MYSDKIVNFNTCPGFPKNQVRLRKRLTHFLREKFHTMRHIRRAIPFVGEQYAGVLALVSHITHQSYKFVSKFIRFIQDFMQFAPVQGPIHGCFLDIPVEIDLTDKIYLVAKLREDLLCSGYLKYGDSTIYLGGIDKNNEGVFSTKGAYRVVKQMVFKDVFYDDLFRILKYNERYWSEIKNGVQQLMAIGGMNEYFVRIQRKTKRKNIYHDSWVDIAHYWFRYVAQIPDKTTFVAPSFSDFTGRISSHMVMQCYEIYILIEGRGHIVVGEQPFNDVETAYNTSVICDGQSVCVMSSECKELFSVEVCTSGEPIAINWRIPSSQFKMKMKRLKLEFNGLFKVHKMSICCRVWETGSVCIADFNVCALQCVPDKYKRCNKGGDCMRAPVSACSICKSAYLNTLFHYSDNFSPRGIIDYMYRSREHREGFEVLKDDVFFYAYKHEVKDCYPIRNRMYSFMREIGALSVTCQIMAIDIDGQIVERKMLIFVFSTRTQKEERIYENFNSFQEFYVSLSDNDWVILQRSMGGYVAKEVIDRLAARDKDILIF